MKLRRTARVYVFDPAGRILLLRLVVPRPEGPFTFWLTPGGEIEPGESPADAAQRELQEELELMTIVEGPLYTEATRFQHQGEMRDNTDFYFKTRCAVDAPRLAGVTAEEIAVTKEIRWWSAAQIRGALAAGQRFYPADLVDRIGQLKGALAN